MAFGYSVYFSERDKNRVMRWDPDSNDVGVVAGEPSNAEPGQTLEQPYGLAFGKDGDLLISDKGNHRICRLRNGRLEPLPLTDVTGHRRRLPESLDGYTPELLCPAGLFSEKSGALLCAFADDFTIYRIVNESELHLVLGRARNRPYYFSEFQEAVPPNQSQSLPVAVPTTVISRSDGTVYFVERLPQTVRRYSPNAGVSCVFSYSRMGEWARAASAPAAFNLTDYHPAYPACLALDGGEVLYVSDARHSCILRIDEAGGRATRVLDSRRPSEATLGGPGTFGFGPDGTAWVLDSHQGTVEAFDPSQAGPWQSLGVKLNQFRGSALQLPQAGSGLAFGR